MIVGSIAKFANNIFPVKDSDEDGNIDFKDLKSLASLDYRDKIDFEW